MSYDVQEHTRKYINAELLYKLSSYMDENECKVVTAFSRTLHVYLHSIIAKSESVSTGRKDVYTIIRDHENFKVLDAFNMVFRDGGMILKRGVDQSRMLLEDKFGKLVQAIAVQDKVRVQSVYILFSITSSVVTGILSKKITCYNLAEKDFWMILDGQRKQIAKTTPPGTKLILEMVGNGYAKYEN